jgi:hypothetical protein
MGEKGPDEFWKSEEAQNFEAHLGNEDMLGVIVRSHLYIEEKLTTLIEINLRQPEKLKLRKKNFSLKIELASALGFGAESLQGALGILNELRNRLSHNLQAEISKSDCLRLYGALPSKLQILAKTDTEPARSLLEFTLTVLFGYLAGMVDKAHSAPSPKK